MPGHTLNPNGRPRRGNTIAGILRKIGSEEMILKNEKSITKRELVLRGVYDEAMNKRAWAVHFIADREDGKPLNSILVENDSLNDLVDRFAGMPLEDLLKIANG